MTRMDDDNSEAERGRTSLPLAYVAPDDALHAGYANHFAVQFQSPGEWVLTVGQVTIPPLLGEPKAVEEQLERMPFLPVRIHGRYTLNRRNLVGLRDLIERQMAATADVDTESAE